MPIHSTRGATPLKSRDTPPSAYTPRRVAEVLTAPVRGEKEDKDEEEEEEEVGAAEEAAVAL